MRLQQKNYTDAKNYSSHYFLFYFINFSYKLLFYNNKNYPDAKKIFITLL